MANMCVAYSLVLAGFYLVQAAGYNPGFDRLKFSLVGTGEEHYLDRIGSSFKACLLRECRDNYKLKARQSGDWRRMMENDPKISSLRPEGLSIAPWMGERERGRRAPYSSTADSSIERIESNPYLLMHILLRNEPGRNCMSERTRTFLIDEDKLHFMFSTTLVPATREEVDELFDALYTLKTDIYEDARNGISKKKPTRNGGVGKPFVTDEDAGRKIIELAFMATDGMHMTVFPIGLFFTMLFRRTDGRTPFKIRTLDLQGVRNAYNWRKPGSGTVRDSDRVAFEWDPADLKERNKNGKYIGLTSIPKEYEDLIIAVTENMGHCLCPGGRDFPKKMLDNLKKGIITSETISVELRVFLFIYNAALCCGHDAYGNYYDPAFCVFAIYDYHFSKLTDYMKKLQNVHSRGEKKEPNVKAIERFLMQYVGGSLRTFAFLYAFSMDIANDNVRALGEKICTIS